MSKKGFKIVKDWAKLHALALSGPQGLMQANVALTGCLNHFFDEPLQQKNQLLASVMEFVGKEDFPAQVLDYVEKFNLSLVPVDDSWRQVFTERDYTDSILSGFKMRNITNGIAFEEILPGEEVKMAKITGAEVTVPFRMFGGGIAYEGAWYMDQDWWSVEEETEAFRSKQYQRLALIHIALVEALSSGVNQSWETDLIQTVNNGCAQLVEDAASAGLEVGKNPTFVWWAPLKMKKAVQYALKAGYFNTNEELNKPLVYDVVPAFSTNFSNNNSGYLCLPGGQMKSGKRMDGMIFGEFNIRKFMLDVTAWFRQGAAIGSTKQVRRIPFSG